MAKTATASVLRPLIFVPRLPVMAEHLRGVVEQQNFSVARRPVVYVNVNGLVRNGAVFGGFAGDAPVANQHQFSAAIDTWLEVIRAHARISADVQSIRCTARCYFASGHTGEIRFTVGADNVVVPVDDSDNGARVEGTLNTADTGTGLVDVSIELRRTGTTPTITNYAINLRIQSAVIAATDLPDPANS